MNKFIRLVIILLCLGTVLVSFLIAIKPGANIFCIKYKIDPQAIVKDAGISYRFRPDVNPFFFRMQDIRLSENGRLQTRTSSTNVVNNGNGTYSIDISSEGVTYIYFSSSDNSNPTTNGRTYAIYLPLTFVSRTNGVVILILLLPLVVRLAIYTLAEPKQRQIITSSPGGIFQVFNRFFDDSLVNIPADLHKLWQEKTNSTFIKRLITTLALAAYFYIFMEWIFIVTMPSFMSLTSFYNKVTILLLSGLWFFIFCAIGAIILTIFDILTGIALKYSAAHYLELAVPSVVLSSLILLLVDNFTYTIFKFGIINSTGIARWLYALFFVFISGYIYIKFLRFFILADKPAIKKSTKYPLFFLSLGLLGISVGLALTKLDWSILFTSRLNPTTQKAASRPNIILLGSDGISADHLSVYGYNRDTTPQLNELAQTSLVADNAFPNASKTAGSIVSLMTSKYPTQTRVMFPPNILTGINAFQHLPGILRSQGYQAVEFGTPYFVDAYSYNFQNAFDMVNNRTEDANSLHALGQKLGFDGEVYFLYLVNDRILNRIQHILFLGQMQNPYAMVTQPAQAINDNKKIAQALNLLDNSQQPIFIHLHLLGTHGSRYNPPLNIFSKGEVQNKSWMVDFYDDTLVAFDKQVGMIIDHLKANGQFDNTILIIYTDHNYKYQVNERIPLMIHFPFGQYAGRIKSNVENIDIAPTIVDYLGIPIPQWMEGESLLHGEPGSHRLIFGSMLSNDIINEDNANELDISRLKPPFYQFSYLDVIDCQRWYVLNLVDNIWSSGDVAGYEFPCSQDSLLSFEEIKQAAIDQLTKDGFNASSIR
jgi:hypothetical protein